MANLTPAEIEAQNLQLQGEGGQAAIPFINAPSAPIPAQQTIPTTMPMPAGPAPIDKSQLAINQPSIAQQSATIPATPSIDISQESQAIQDAAKAGQEAAKQEAVFSDNFYKEQQAQAKQQLEEQQLDEQAIEAKINIAQQELDKIASQKIEPNRLFSNASIWEKLGTVVLGALAGPGGAQIIQNRINQDIAAQEKNLDSAYTAANKKMSYLQELRDVYKDSRMAKEALRAGMYQAAQMKLQGFAARTKNADAQAKASQQIAELEISKQEALSKIAKNAQGQVANEQMAASDPVTAAILKYPEKLQKPLLEAKEVYDATQAALKSIDDSYSATSKIGLSAKIPLSDSKAIVDSENAKIESAIRATMKGQGTIQESEIERLVKPFLINALDPASVRAIKREKLKSLLLTKNAGQLDKLKNFGLTKSNPGQSAAKTLKKN